MYLVKNNKHFEDINTFVVREDIGKIPLEKSIATRADCFDSKLLSRGRCYLFLRVRTIIDYFEILKKNFEGKLRKQWAEEVGNSVRQLGE